MTCEHHWHDEGIWEFCCECNAHKCEAIERVRELHKLVTENNAACGNPDCCGEYEEWEVCADCQCDYPCPTIKILDGEQ